MFKKRFFTLIVSRYFMKLSFTLSKEHERGICNAKAVVGCQVIFNVLVMVICEVFLQLMSCSLILLDIRVLSHLNKPPQNNKSGSGIEQYSLHVLMGLLHLWRPLWFPTCLRKHTCYIYSSLEHLFSTYLPLKSRSDSDTMVHLVSIFGGGNKEWPWYLDRSFRRDPSLLTPTT